MARSRGLLSVPKYYKGSKPNSHWTELIYATQPEIEKLRKLDMHNSGIDKENHYGPGGLLNMNEGDTLDVVYGGNVPDKIKDMISDTGNVPANSVFTPKPRVGRRPPFAKKPEASVYAGPGYSTKPVSPLDKVPDWRKNVFPDKPKKDKTKPDKTKTKGGVTKSCPPGFVGNWPNCRKAPTKDPEDDVITPTDKCLGVRCAKNHHCVDGNCVKDSGPGPGGNGNGNGGDAPTLTTITKPDETPMLQELTNEMDLRNMLSNVLNKNNPLFKQARTRALQAMAGRGLVNSSMAEKLVMENILNVAMPIAQRVITDLQNVMKENVNASNAFKMALNQAYYNELLTRVEAANTWNLTKMQEGGMNWRAMLEAKAGAANIKEKDPFERYMDMLSGRTYGNI